MRAVHGLKGKSVGFEMDIDVLREQFHVLKDGGKYMTLVDILDFQVESSHGFCKQLWCPILKSFTIDSIFYVV